MIYYSILFTTILNNNCLSLQKQTLHSNIIEICNNILLIILPGGILDWIPSSLILHCLVPGKKSCHKHLGTAFWIKKSNSWKCRNESIFMFLNTFSRTEDLEIFNQILLWNCSNFIILVNEAKSFTQEKQ